MNGREIPGFYFDPEKKKYFKIQKPHTAPRADSKYSSDSVKREQQRQNFEKHEATHLQRRVKQTIVRRHDHNFLTQATLDREIGRRKSSYYLHSIWPNACAWGLKNSPRKIVDRPESGVIRHFDRDPATKTLYTVQGDNNIKRRRLNAPDGVPLPSTDLDLGDYANNVPINEYSFEPWDELARLTSPISSLTYLPASGALAATTFGSDRPPVVYLSDPDRDGPYVNQQFTPKDTSAIWGQAARPTSFEWQPAESNRSIAASETENLVVAASKTLLLFERSPSGSWDSSTILKNDADILALDWLSPTIVVLGGRNGKIRLYDTRSEGSSHILTHPYPTLQIRRADDPTRLICAGLQDSLFLYDIRSPRTSSTASTTMNSFQYNQRKGDGSQNKRLKMSHTMPKACSQPVIRYQHASHDNLSLDLDVHPRLGLIAAAQDRSMHRASIRVHNMWTGKVVKEINRCGGSSQAGADIQCLKFVEDEENGELALWASWAGGIACFGWRSFETGVNQFADPGAPPYHMSSLPSRRW